MFFRFSFIMLGLAWLLAQGPSSVLAADEPAQTLAAARQLVLVLAADWDSSAGLMRCYERTTAGGTWVRVGDDVPVSLGRSGLGWGRGVHGSPLAEGPLKREGDGKSPAGIFFFGEVFTSAPSELRSVDLPTLTSTPTLVCVDDVNSHFYNTLQDTAAVNPDWKSSERMQRKDGVYRHGLIVRHNLDPVEPGAGSCIFFHIWKGVGQGTSGCTAMSEGDLLKLLRWLDPQSAPVLVQLPEPVLEIAIKTWGFPER